MLFATGLTQEDLDNPSPYNTREVVGIPPTPIAAPGEASLIAAMRPQGDPDLYYWVRTDAGGVVGAHTFAVTDAEFQAAKQICQELGYC